MSSVVPVLPFRDVSFPSLRVRWVVPAPSPLALCLDVWLVPVTIIHRSADISMEQYFHGATTRGRAISTRT
jgi:hypothetical protein